MLVCSYEKPCKFTVRLVGFYSSLPCQDVLTSAKFSWTTAQTRMVKMKQREPDHFMKLCGFIGESLLIACSYSGQSGISLIGVHFWFRVKGLLLVVLTLQVDHNHVDSFIRCTFMIVFFSSVLSLFCVRCQAKNCGIAGFIWC